MAGDGESAARVSSPQDSLVDFGDDPRPVNFRGGSIAPEAFVQVSQDGDVETPMPLVFPAGVDAKLSDRARNQVRTVVASATDERGTTPRADPFWIERDAAGNVALMVIVDNPSEDDLGKIAVTAELLLPNGDPNGTAKFEIPPRELDALAAGDAAFFVLTFGKDRLKDPTSDVASGGVRLDLVYS